MAGRHRWWLAALCLGLFALAPAADRFDLTRLMVRAWLLGPDSPFFRAVPPMQPLPALLVETAPPMATEDLARSLREWGYTHLREPGTGVMPLRLVVRIGDEGYRASLLAHQAGAWREIARDERLFADRTCLLPPVLAIVLALLTGHVLLALVAGGLAGTIALHGGNGLSHFAVQTLGQQVLTQHHHLELIASFVFLFVAIGAMAASGGLQGMAVLLGRFAKGPVSTQLVGLAMGLSLFAYDATACVLVGGTMLPLCDQQRVSRAKLAYIVNATAAVVAGLALVPAMFGFVDSTFAGQMRELGGPDGFARYAQTLPYSFYGCFTLGLVLLTIVLRRELPPMVRAPAQAPAPAAAGSAVFALVPFATLILVTLGLPLVLPHHGPTACLALATALAMLLALTLPVLARRIALPRLFSGACAHARPVWRALAVLIFAWCLGKVCAELGTATWLAAALPHEVSPRVLPIALLLLAAAIAFATGSSWSPLAILLPNVVLLAHALGSSVPELGGPLLLVLAIGAVLEGACFGAHASPFSDITLLAATSSGCALRTHVQAQTPYALLALATSLVCGYLPVLFVAPALWPLCLLAGIGVQALVLWRWGRAPASA